MLDFAFSAFHFPPLSTLPFFQLPGFFNCLVVRGMICGGFGLVQAHYALQYFKCKGEAYLLRHCQSRVKVSLIYENRYAAVVPVALANRCENECENDTEAVRTHWLNSLHLPSPNVLASTVQHCATIVKWFYACPTVKGCHKLKTSARHRLIPAWLQIPFVAIFTDYSLRPISKAMHLLN